MRTAQIKRPTKDPVPYFSDDDLAQLAEWINNNLTDETLLSLSSVIEGDDEVLKATII